MQVTSVRVHRAHTTSRSYDAITVVIGDLHLRCDVTCARDIRMAKRLAEENGVSYFCEPAVWERFPGGPDLADEKSRRNFYQEAGKYVVRGGCRHCGGPSGVICGGQCKNKPEVS